MTIGDGGWMQTYTGRAFRPLDPDSYDVVVEDIAHALSNICRYGGHTRRFYSVAEHSLLISYAVSPDNALWALLHDASEAYLGDVIRPLKMFLPDYKLIEHRVQAVICARFGLPWEEGEPPEIKQADTRILHDERAVLLGAPPMTWDVLENVEPLGVRVVGHLPEVAEKAWLERFHELSV